jgi:hypothetical protein
MSENTDPIRVDMGAKDNALGEAIMAALLSGRPLVMHDSTRPEVPEVGIGMDLEMLPEGGGNRA